MENFKDWMVGIWRLDWLWASASVLFNVYLLLVYI
jgi:hypothetical protein